MTVMGLYMTVMGLYMTVMGLYMTVMRLYMTVMRLYMTVMGLYMTVIGLFMLQALLQFLKDASRMFDLVEGVCIVSPSLPSYLHLFMVPYQ